MLYPIDTTLDGEQVDTIDNMELGQNTLDSLESELWNDLRDSNLEVGLWMYPIDTSLINPVDTELEGEPSVQAAFDIPGDRDDLPENVYGALEAADAAPTAAATEETGRSRPTGIRGGLHKRKTAGLRTKKPAVVKDKPINKTGSRGGGRKLTAEGMLLKDDFRKKHGSSGGVYQFPPSPSYRSHIIKIVGIAESSMKEEYDAVPPHLINILQEEHGKDLKPFNYIKITPAAKTRLIHAYIANGRSSENQKDMRATWQRITQILNDLGFQAVPGANCASGQDILSGNSDFHFSREGWNDVGHRCCVGGRNRASLRKRG